jgi:hypothetical protein
MTHWLLGYGWAQPFPRTWRRPTRQSDHTASSHFVLFALLSRSSQGQVIGGGVGPVRRCPLGPSQPLSYKENRCIPTLRRSRLRPLAVRSTRRHGSWA